MILRDARADEIADAEEERRQLGAERQLVQRRNADEHRLVPQLEAARDELIRSAESDADEDRPRRGPAAVAGDQYRRAGGALGEGQPLVLGDRQLVAQRDEHQDAEQTGGRRQEEDAEAARVVPEEQEAGTVNAMPAASESPDEAVVCTTLFSRIVPRPMMPRSTAIESTAAGIDADAVRPP
jgi:hypothetical protein